MSRGVVSFSEAKLAWLIAKLSFWVFIQPFQHSWLQLEWKGCLISLSSNLLEASCFMFQKVDHFAYVALLMTKKILFRNNHKMNYLVHSLHVGKPSKLVCNSRKIVTSPWLYKHFIFHLNLKLHFITSKKTTFKEFQKSDKGLSCFF